MSAPSENSGALLLGYSLPRILLALVLIVPSMLSTFLFAQMLKSGVIVRQIDRFFKRAVNNPFLFWAIFGVAVAVGLSLWILFFLPEKRAVLWFGPLSLYIAAIKPLLLFGIVTVGFGVLHLLKARYGIKTKYPKAEMDLIRPTLVVLIGFLAILGFISLSGIGLGFDASVWNAPGTPVLISQVFFVLFGAIILIAAYVSLSKWFLRTRLSKKFNKGLFMDLGLAGLIWFLAAIFWLAQPAPSTYYDTAPQLPNYQSYPLSDAFNHDVIANNALIGEGFHFGGQVAIRRPVYVLFLAGLEGLFGGNYGAVIVGQVIVLALFPAFLYLLGTKLHSRLTGVLLAGLITFREANSIVLGDVINTSHAKLLMADLPTALMVAGLALAAVAWLRWDVQNLVAPLLVGGLLGWAILLRSQSLTLLPFFVLIASLVWGWRKAWKPILLFVLGVALVAGPWIVRNRLLMGELAIEDAVVSGFLANRYSFTPGTYGLPFLAGESEGEYYARQMAHVRDFASQNPGYVASFVVDNFVRNQLLNFLATPLSFQLRDLESHVRELSYWPGWEGQLDVETYLPMVINLSLVSLGITVAWKRFRWIGLAPLFINVGFTLNLALARVSGWRYNLPVDWTVLLYYAIGLAQVVIWSLLLMKYSSFIKSVLANLFATKSNTSTLFERSSLPQTRYVLLAIFSLLFLGSSFLFIEALSLPRYSAITNEEAVSEISLSEPQGSATETGQRRLIDLISSGALNVINGRALHPRYYRAGEGETGRDFVLIDTMDFERITFYLIGPNPGSIVLRVDGPDMVFPASSDVVVFRCGNTLEAAAVIVRSPGTQDRLYISSDLSKSCPVRGN